MDSEDDKFQNVGMDISLLQVEFMHKWKYQTTMFGEGMIPLPAHKKLINELMG